MKIIKVTSYFEHDILKCSALTECYELRYNFAEQRRPLYQMLQQKSTILKDSPLISFDKSMFQTSTEEIFSWKRGHSN